MSWRDDDEIARLRVENAQLRAQLANTRMLAGYIGPERRPQHLYEGRCPDQEHPSSRDLHCWACMAMDEANKQETDR